MRDFFVILQQSDNWYFLCVKDTMFCIACGDWDTVIKSLKDILKRYKTSSNLIEHIMDSSDGGRVNKSAYASRTSLYKVQGDKYNKVINEVINDHYAAMTEKRKPRKVLTLARSKSPVVEEKVVVATPPKKGLLSPPSAVKKVYTPLKLKKRV